MPTQTPTKFVREEFIKALKVLIGQKLEYLLIDGSKDVGFLQHFNPNTGEYYLIDEFSNVHIISHHNCLRMIIKV